MRLPSVSCLGLFLHGLLAANYLAGAGSGNNQFRAAFGAAISLSHLVGHVCTTFQNTIVRDIIIFLCRVVNFSDTAWCSVELHIFPWLFLNYVRYTGLEILTRDLNESVNPRRGQGAKSQSPHTFLLFKLGAKS